MAHDSGAYQFSQQILCPNCCHHESPDQASKQKDNQYSSKQSCFLTDDGKNHIILCFGYKSQFLQTVSHPTPEDSPTSDRIQALDRLKPFFIFFRIPPDGKAFKPLTFHTQKNRDKSNPRGSDSKKRQIPRVCHKDQNHADTKNNNRRTQIICSHQPDNR